jgi:hypothetical protein
MNRLLANVLSVLNVIAAISIIVAGASAGWDGMVNAQFGTAWPEPVGAAIGALIGLVAAAVVCGLVACIVDIRRSLSDIVDLELQAGTPRPR